MYIRGPKPTFDIRDLILGAEDDNDLLQANYDTVNRMILLIGDLPFRDLFTGSWKDIIPHIESKLPETINLHLLRGRPELKGYHAAASFRHLRNTHGTESWHSYLSKSFNSKNREAVPDMHELYKHHVALWQQGIYLPCLQGRIDSDGRRLVSVENLVNIAGDRTYKEYFQRRLKTEHPQFDADLKAKWTLQMVNSVKAAAQSGALFDIRANGRCCNSDTGRCEPNNPDDICFDCDEGETPCEPPGPLDDTNKDKEPE